MSKDYTSLNFELLSKIENGALISHPKNTKF
jgi:hypothetical protein